MKAVKFIPSAPPFPQESGTQWYFRSRWPAKWICPEADPCALAATYRRKFTLEKAAKLKIHVSADSVFRIACDGVEFGRGPERGAPQLWSYDSYELSLSAGKHELTALVFHFGDMGPCSVMGASHAFLLAAEAPYGELLSTGTAPYEVRIETAYAWRERKSIAGYLGREWLIDGSKLEKGRFDKVKVLGDAATAEGYNEYKAERLLLAATLPERRGGAVRRIKALYVDDRCSGAVDLSANRAGEQAMVQEFLDGKGEFRIKAGERRRVLLKLNDYHTFDYELAARGADGRITFEAAEGLHLENSDRSVKGNRDEFDGKFFVGTGEEFLTAAGSRIYSPHHYRSGRYIMLECSAGKSPLVLERLCVSENRYPMKRESVFTSPDAALQKLDQLALRTLEMCANDTFMDCPYYEQLMYLGDVRLELLTFYATTSDRRLAEKTLRLFAAAMLPEGLTPSRFPSRTVQVIPTFSMLFIGILRDWTLYCGKLPPDLRARVDLILGSFEKYLTSSGLLKIDRGWCFADWTPNWCRDGRMGIPPNGEYGISGVMNLFYLRALEEASEMNRNSGDEARAGLYAARAEALAPVINKTFFDSGRGLFADTEDKTVFSEHAQVLALLSPNLVKGKAAGELAARLFSEPELTRCTIYFSHYYFEVCRKFSRADKFFERLELWRDCVKLGLKTLLERPEPSRSDCHAWSSHIHYHFMSTLLGVRPAAAGFSEVEIAPLPSGFPRLGGVFPHPAGAIRLEFDLSGGDAAGSIELPDGLSGTFRFGKRTLKLKSGVNKI